MDLFLANVDRRVWSRSARRFRDDRIQAAPLPGQEWAPAYDNSMTAAMFAA
jgi:hypothetical protein